MFIFFPLLFGIIGIIMCSIPFFLDISMLPMIYNTHFTFVFMLFGIVFVFIGWFMMFGRAKKVGADILIAPARPDKKVWFYIHKDANVKIVSVDREPEGFSYSKKLDMEAQDLKSYRLFDHTVSFVPEGLGHCVDLGMIYYTYILKNKWGIKNIKQAREHDGTVEHVIDGKEMNNMQGDIDVQSPE